jgi:hypothetical protein
MQSTDPTGAPATMEDPESASGAGMGMIVFASIVMVMIGMMHAIWGLSAIINDQFFVVTENYIFQFDVSTWGWIHLIAGIIVFLAGFSLYSGAVWARAVGVVLAVISIIANFASMPYYPFWSILMIALAVFVIWALTVHGDAFAS